MPTARRRAGSTGRRGRWGRVRRKAGAVGRSAIRGGRLRPVGRRAPPTRRTCRGYPGRTSPPRGSSTRCPGTPTRRGWTELSVPADPRGSPEPPAEWVRWVWWPAWDRPRWRRDPGPRGAWARPRRAGRRRRSPAPGPAGSAGRRGTGGRRCAGEGSGRPVGRAARAPPDPPARAPRRHGRARHGTSRWPARPVGPGRSRCPSRRCRRPPGPAAAGQWSPRPTCGTWAHSRGSGRRRRRRAPPRHHR